MNLGKIAIEQLLLLVILGEAEGEDFLGKVSVSCVIRNRANDPRSRWPSTLREVILQPMQFSCINAFSRTDPLPSWVERRWLTRRTDYWWKEARLAAQAVLYDWISDQTNGANHYYAKSLPEEPYWAKGKAPCFVHGGHIFLNL